MIRIPRPLLALLIAAHCWAPMSIAAQAAPRARDLGVPFDGTPGPHNAITDVAGVLVGHSTLVRGGEGADAVRTGVTAILPRKELGYYPAATFVLNGDAELSGAIFAEEFGLLRSPIMLTGTGSNGTVYTSVIKWSAQRLGRPVNMPVVADTWDADLSDYLSFPLAEADVFAALDGARSGPVAEGNVGGGTGMVCHEFKCGIGTASRVLPADQGAYTVGVLVQANYGRRDELRIAGVPVGRLLEAPMPEWKDAPEPAKEPEHDGSILVVVATDAPVSSHTLKAMARRAALGLARNGATANPGSGDVVVAFATTKVEVDEKPPHFVRRDDTLFEYATDALYLATVRATEEAVVNALVAGRTMTGRYGTRVHGIPLEPLRELMRSHAPRAGAAAASD